MSRIAHVARDALPDEINAILNEGQSLMGFLPNDALVMAHRPEVLSTFLGLVKAVYGSGPVAPSLKRLIGLVASREAGCRYCVAHTAHSARQLGVPLDKLNALCDFANSALFTCAEKAALGVAQGAARTPGDVSDDAMATLAQHYDAAAQVDILSVIALFGFLNRWNATLRTDIEDVPAASLAMLDPSMTPTN